MLFVMVVLKKISTGQKITNRDLNFLIYIKLFMVKAFYA
ncbi:hypothetical protein [Methylomonas albis]|nr:hypothetical protein [Methylomonas albis]